MNFCAVMKNDSLSAYLDMVKNKAHLGDTPWNEITLTKLFRHVKMRVVSLARHRLKSFDISEAAYQALIALYISPEQAILPSALSEVLDSSRTSVTRIADELCEKGYVIRCHCGEDRRKLYLRLTKVGLAFLQEIFPIMREFHKEVWQVYSEIEKQQLEAYLFRLLHHLEALETSGKQSFHR